MVCGVLRARGRARTVTYQSGLPLTFVLHLEVLEREGITLKTLKTYQIIVLVIVCILCNCAGRALTTRFSLPLWLDSFGTVCSAYILGGICGCMVGVTGNLIFSAIFHSPWIYFITSISIALLVGFFSRRKSLDTRVGTMSLGILCVICASIISVPLNYIYYKGMTGNTWGDGIINLLLGWKWPRPLCLFFGEFYVEFWDKLITLFVVHAAIKIFRKVRARRAPRSGTGVISGLTVFAAVLVSGALIPASASHADAAASTNYSDYVQTVYSSDNGLPCGAANDITQTNDGILWIGTYAGLYRYNGREFKWMDGYDTVRNVNCLYTDDEGRLWIGTNDNGLAISINEKIVNVIDQSNGLPSDSVRSIIESSDGYYYIGTTSSMQILTLNSGLKKVSSLWEVNFADHITADEDGHVAAVTSDGRLFLMKSGQIICSMQFPKGNEQINCCEFDRHGNLYVGTSTSRLHLYDISDGDFRELSNFACVGLSSINNLNLLENGELFLSAENGIACLDADKNYQLINVNSFNNSIDNMVKDYQGNLWFTSSRLGLLRLAPSAFRDLYSAAGMEPKVVNTIEKWQGDYYIGTDNGLDIIDGTSGRKKKSSLATQLGSTRIRCIFADSRETLWLCTYGNGLWEITPDGNIYLYNTENGSFGNRARLASELSDGTVVAAGDTGLCFIRDHKILHTIRNTDGLINTMILSVIELDDGTVLAGTDGDGIAVLKDQKVSQMFTREDGLSSGVILRMVRDEKGNGVFIVTSNGLCYMDSDFSIRILDNFPYFNNYDIRITDDDTMFVTGSSGIYVVNREELLSGSSISYDLMDARKGLNSALTANSWNYYGEEGFLYLCCDNGAFVADIDSYMNDVHTYHMNVASVFLDGEQYHVDSNAPITVSRDVKKIELFPEVINYTVQDPNVGYYLEGFDNHWTVVPQSSLSGITYTNIPSGSYTFHMAVLGRDESQVLAERTYSLVKPEDIYDKPWFIAYAAVSAMLFGFFLLYLWFRRVLEQANLRIRMGDQTIEAIANTVDAKDVRTSQHSMRVGKYSVLIAQKMGFSKKECENLRKAASLHDIGKIAIPDSILNKPSRLTDEEYAIMKSHTTRGEEILSGFTLVEHVKEGALYHHERYDGRGYPQGLKGEDIPLYGRIIGVADAFDAMTANRIYRNQMDIGYVLNELRKGRGTQFDPQVVDIFLQILEEGTIDINKLYPQMQSTDTGDKPSASGKGEAGKAEGTEKDSRKAEDAGKAAGKE